MSIILRIIRFILLIGVNIAHKITLLFFPNNKATPSRKIYCLIILFLIMFISVLAVGLLSIDYKKVLTLKNYKPSLPSTIYDRDGKVISKLFREYRIIVSPDKISKQLQQAFISIEDNHFYEHHGIDIQTIIRAFLVNLRYGTIKQGGSTITQQLSKLLVTSRERKYIRKLKEALIAIYIETKFSKAEILTMYLNQIYFGHGNYGIEAASQFYFQKSIDQINVGQMAILASLPSAPNGYSPFKNPRRSIHRVCLVLLKMIDAGFITEKEAIDNFQKLIPFYKSLNSAGSLTAFGLKVDNAPYFTELVRKKLLRMFDAEKVYEGGLQVYTSLDLQHQKSGQTSLWKALENYNQNARTIDVSKQLAFSKRYADVLDLTKLVFNIPEFRNKKQYHTYETQLHFFNGLAEKIELLNFGIGIEPNLGKFIRKVYSKNSINQVSTNRIEGALVELDNKTGEITTMVGGSPFSTQNQLNRAVQIKRQPGSTIKPIVYALALNREKVQASTMFSDTPLFFIEEDSREWLPENYGGDFSGFVSVREALKDSINLVSISIAREFGVENLAKDLSEIIEEDVKNIPKNLTLALGSHEMSPIQLAKAFSMIPRGGMSLPIVSIKKITDNNGNVIYKKKKESPKKLIRKGTATIVNSFLEEVIEDGTGKIIRASGVNWFVAGKTGTTQNYKDAWFVGYNKRYTTAIWIGYDRSSTSLGSGKSGGIMAAPIWADFQKKTFFDIEDDEPSLNFGQTVEIEVCKNYNKRPSEYCLNTCNETYTEIFIDGGRLPALCTEELYNTSSYVNNSQKSMFDLDMEEDSL